MVVLEQSAGDSSSSNKPSSKTSANTSSTTNGLVSNSTNSFYQSPYLQPLPSDSEMDSKISPLAMLTRACNKIESDMMNSSSKGSAAVRNNNLSPRLDSGSSNGRPRSTEQKRPSTSSPSAASAGRKCSPPLKSAGSTTSKTSSFSPPAPSTSKATSPKSASPNASSASSMANYTMAAMAAAAAGLPPVLPPNSMSAYASMPAPPSLTRPGGASGSNPCTDPLCRDPTCPTTMLRQAQYASLMAAAASGRNPFMYPGGFPPVPGLAGLPYPPASAASGAELSPYVCNWVNGGDFCGKKFSSSEDLMNHLRTHTSSSASATASSLASSKSTKPLSKPSLSPPADPALAALQAAQAQAAALYSSSQPASALAALQAQAARVAASSVTTTANATTPSSSSADLLAYAAAARFHPYARPGASSLLPPNPLLGAGAAPGLPSPLSAAAAFPPYGLPSPYGLPLL